MYSSILCLFTLFASFFFATASPVPVNATATATAELEKRTTHSGKATWYQPGLGNCGQWDDENEWVVAMSKDFYDSNGGSNCNQWMEIKSNGKTAYAKMRDSCPGCGWNNIDLSPAVFKKLGSLDTGVIPVKWHFMAKGWSP